MTVPHIAVARAPPSNPPPRTLIAKRAAQATTAPAVTTPTARTTKETPND